MKAERDRRAMILEASGILGSIAGVGELLKEKDTPKPE
jgi:hypothetical protein